MIRLAFRALVGVLNDHPTKYADIAFILNRCMTKASASLPWSERQQLEIIAAKSDKIKDVMFQL